MKKPAITYFVEIKSGIICDKVTHESGRKAATYLEDQYRKYSYKKINKLRCPCFIKTPDGIFVTEFIDKKSPPKRTKKSN